MTEERNTLAWPSIEQFPREVCSRINRFFECADRAATIIARAHRGIKPDGTADLRGGKRSRLHAWLLDGAVCSSVKLDGTNVGVLRDGTLLGRRLVIDADATSYQKCDLKALRALDTAGVLDDLLALGADGGRGLTRCALYGELVCNNLYSYVADGIAKSWLAFGALAEFESEEAAVAFAAAASAAGLVCNHEDTGVRIANNEAFADLCGRHGVPVTAPTAHASLCAAVASGREWMVSEQGEGVVLNVDRGTGKASTYKWKISREPQPAAVDALTALVAALDDGAGGKAVLLDAPIREMVAALLAVATHVDSSVAAAAAAGKGAGKPAKPTKAMALDAAAVQTAIASALTKFDSVEAHFDAHGQANGQAAMATLSERLMAEVFGDAELAMPAEGTAAHGAAAKEVSLAVKKFVGVTFGAWKKARELK